VGRAGSLAEGDERLARSPSGALEDVAQAAGQRGGGDGRVVLAKEDSNVDTQAAGIATRQGADEAHQAVDHVEVGSPGTTRITDREVGRLGSFGVAEDQSSARG
jgi:hypothetical protein